MHPKCMAVDEQKLKRLAKCFAKKARLYQVGGCVRDELLGVECFDVDVCSQLDVETVKTMLLNTDFVVSDKNLRMGTVHITSGDFCVEYTTFRTDSYDRSSGKHSPDNVAFTTDMTLDARRRDFKCNALYKDVLTGEIIDLLGGEEDVKNKIISTADDPNSVFEADGLRILRMVRFACELGFDVEKETYAVAKKNAWRVEDLAVERIRDELCKIFVADTKHPELNLKGAHVKGLEMLDDLGLVDLILPELASLKGLQQPKKYHLYEAYEHSKKAFEVAPPNIRWAALLHDVGKAVCMKKDGNMHRHAIVGEKMVEQIAQRLKFSNAEIDRMSRLVALHMVDINGNTSESKLRVFCVENAPYIDDLLSLMDADAIASAGEITRENRVRKVWGDVKAANLPLRIKDLKIGGNDLLALGAKGVQCGEILKSLLRDTALDPTLNDREKALSYAKKKIEKSK